MPIHEQVTPGSAGFDLSFAGDAAIVLTEYPVTLPTGVRVAIPQGFVGLLRGRRGLAFKHGVQVFNGTIDSDYRGEIAVSAWCIGGFHTVRPGDRIAQLVIVPHLSGFESLIEVSDV